MRRFTLISLSVFLVLLFAVPAFAVEPATFMRSNVTFDFLESSILTYTIAGSRPSSGTTSGYLNLPAGTTEVTFRADYTSVPDVTEVYITVELEGYTGAMGSPAFVCNGMPCSVVLVSGSRFILRCSLRTTPVYLWFKITLQAALSSSMRCCLYDISGIGNTNTVFGNLEWYRVASNFGYTKSAGISSSTFTYTHAPLVTGITQLGVIYYENISVSVPMPTDGKFDFVSFRFYLPSTHVSYNSYDDSFTVEDGSPLISFSVGYSPTSTMGSIASVPGAVVYETASNSTYFGPAGCICYDVTVDIASLGASSILPYLTLTLEIEPYNYLPSTQSLQFGARFNGGSCGYYSHEDNQLNTWTNWYFDYSERKIAGLETFFGGYLQSIVDLLGQDVPEVSEANAAIDDNASKEEAAVSAGVDAASDVMAAATVPSAVLAGMSNFSAVSGFLSNGFGLTLLSCLVLVPLAVGIISKLLNGGD